MKWACRRKTILTNLKNDPQIIKMNKLAKITDMIFSLDELDNTNNLKGGRPSNTLFTYYVSNSEHLCILNPITHNIRNLKMVTDQIITL